MSSKEILEKMIGKYKEDQEVKKEIAGMNKTFQFSPSDGSPYFISISNGKIEIKDGLEPKPTTTITAKEETLTDLFNGKIDPVMSYMTGKLKISGDLMSATKITGLVKKLRE